jgi:nucleotide-binding universal stress UspA family protein
MPTSSWSVVAGETSQRASLLGSVATRIIANAPCDVLVVS